MPSYPVALTTPATTPPDHTISPHLCHPCHPRSQPVFVYIPCGAELRGGAWVVLDSQINPGVVEMYADPGARGGVLEPEGIVEIKFREAELVRAMHRWAVWQVRLAVCGQDSCGCGCVEGPQGCAVVGALWKACC
jgi:hypothetical protein